MAFDFDEMEAEAEARLAAGDDEVARLVLGSAEPPDAWSGDLLPPMRNVRRESTRNLLAIHDLPECFPKMQLQPPESTCIRMRLFVFYGAGDSVAGWVKFMTSLPSWLDAAVYEVGGHGLRSQEEIPETMVHRARDAYMAVAEVLKDHARSGPTEGAPFALLGHSMGAQVMVEVAVMLKRSLGLEPACLFALDRGAPHLKLYSEEGHRLLCLDEPVEFFQGFNPMIHRLMLRSTRHQEKETERMIRMWQKDLQQSQEHVWSVGHHIFRCPIHVFCATRNFSLDLAVADGKSLPVEVQQVHEILCKVTNSGADSSAIWSRSSYDAWKAWTAATCTVHDIDCDHPGIKDHAQTLLIIQNSLG